MKGLMNLWKLFVLGLMFVLCGALTGNANAVVSIQAMIDAAPDGGTVTIGAGTYNETLTVNKNLFLVGSGSVKPILHPGAIGNRVIYVTSGHNLTLKNLVIDGGAPTDSNGGGGVFLEDGSLTLEGCLVTNNTASYGGGIFQRTTGNGTLTVIDSDFGNNSAAIHGGGIYAAGDAVLINTNLTGNVANVHGGGIHANKSLQISGGSITNNHAVAGNGGGINLNDNLSVEGTDFLSNSAGGNGGGLNQWNSGKTVSITNAAFSINNSGTKGGGAYIGSHMSIIQSTFSANMAGSFSGTVDAAGGGLYAGDGLDGTRVAFYSNAAQCKTCIFEDGGGLYIGSLNAGSPSTIHSSVFDGNDGWFGGGIFSEGNVILSATDSVFSNNKGGYGGGIQAVDNFNGTNLLFDNNISPNGAALAITRGPAVLRYSSIGRPVNANDAMPALYFGDSTNSGTLNLRNTIIDSYGVVAKGSGSLTEDYNLFFGNTALFTGVGVSSGGHSLTGQDPKFVDPAKGNYHLGAGSAAVGKGQDLGVTTDLDGMPRRNPPAIGAYELWFKVFLPVTLR